MGNHYLEGEKIVTAEEMRRIEAWAIEKGASEEMFMEAAGRKVAAAVMETGFGKRVTLLVGKGNKGGDAYVCGLTLLEEGYQVRAIALYKFAECSLLNQKFGKKFQKKGGKISSGIEFGDEDLIVDGLLGTGFKGRVSEEIELTIQRAMNTGKPIIAIDIPSGLNGSTGEIGGSAIEAVETIALGLPKAGFFLRQGWNCIGKLRVVDIGLALEAVKRAEAVAYLPKRDELKLPKMKRNRHKYEAGYVVGFAGSKEMPGAAKLAGLAALRAGAGVVRIFHRGSLGEAPNELICNPWKTGDWKEALQKAKALFIGPGLGKSKGTHQWLKTHLKKITLPLVLDADALLPQLEFPEQAILTPHRGEMLRLLELKKFPEEEELYARVIRFCERKKVVVVLKGAPTFIFAPHRAPVVVPRGDPGMATAGTGDVLTGVLAGLLAQGLPCHEAAVLGVYLHAVAGEQAAKEMGSYSMIASDLIAALPEAFRDEALRLHIPREIEKLD